MVCNLHQVDVENWKNYVDAVCGSSAKPTTKKRVSRYLRDPFWRPLLELDFNGCTSYENGLILKAAGYIRVGTFIGRVHSVRGMHIECIEFTDEGLNQLHYYHSNTHLDEPLLDLFNAIQNYAVVDRGAGIVATRSLLEPALEYEDGEILGRVCSLVRAGDSLFGPFSRRISEQERMDYMALVSDMDVERTGAAVIEFI